MSTQERNPSADSKPCQDQQPLTLDPDIDFHILMHENAPQPDFVLEMPQEPQPKPSAKRVRMIRSCDNCRVRKIKCNGPVSQPAGSAGVSYMPCPGCLREGFLCEWQDRDHYFRERHRISASGSGRSKRDRHASSSPAAAAGSSHGERLHARRHRPVAGGLEAIAETQNPQGNGLIAPLPTWDYDYSRRCFNYSSDSESSLGSAIPSPSPSHSADYISAVEDIQASSFMPNSDALSGEDIFGLPPSLSPGSIMSPMGTAATASFDATPALAGLDESFDFLTPLDGAVRLPDASTTPLEGLWTDFDWSTLSSAPIPSQAGALPLNDSYYYAADAAWYMPRHGFPGCA